MKSKCTRRFPKLYRYGSQLESPRIVVFLLVLFFLGLGAYVAKIALSPRLSTFTHSEFLSGVQWTTSLSRGVENEILVPRTVQKNSTEDPKLVRSRAARFAS